MIPRQQSYKLTDRQTLKKPEINEEPYFPLSRYHTSQNQNREEVKIGEYKLEKSISGIRQPESSVVYFNRLKETESCVLSPQRNINRYSQNMYNKFTSNSAGNKTIILWDKNHTIIINIKLNIMKPLISNYPSLKQSENLIFIKIVWFTPHKNFNIFFLAINTKTTTTCVTRYLLSFVSLFDVCVIYAFHPFMCVDKRYAFLEILLVKL